MGKRGGLRAELGGEAIYAWLVGEHLRDIKEASRNITDGGLSYHAAVNEFFSLVAGDIGYYTKDWEKWQRENLLQPNGQPLPPNSRLSKNHRRREVAHAVTILRHRGVLGYNKKPFSDDASQLAAVMDGGKANVAVEDQDDEDDAGDEDDGEYMT